MQAVIVPAGTEVFKALPDGPVLHAGDPQPLHRLGASGQMVGGAENQLSLPASVAGVHHLGHVLPAQQGPQGVELAPFLLPDSKAPAFRQDGQILPPPLAVPGVIGRRLGQLRQMPHAPAHQPAPALHVALLPGRGPQHLGDAHGNRRLFRNHQLIHKNHSLQNRERPRFLSKPLENYGLFWIKGWSTIEGQTYCEVSYEKICAVPLVKGRKN